VFAKGHAAVGTEHISPLVRGTTTSAQYGGRGVCDIESGGEQVAKVDITFLGYQRTGKLEGAREGSPWREGRVRRQPSRAVVRPG
jgi:sulfide:quinone oxidoreductase